MGAAVGGSVGVSVGEGTVVGVSEGVGGGVSVGDGNVAVGVGGSGVSVAVDDGKTRTVGGASCVPTNAASAPFCSALLMATTIVFDAVPRAISVNRCLLAKVNKVGGKGGVKPWAVCSGAPIIGVGTLSKIGCAHRVQTSRDSVITETANVIEARRGKETKRGVVRGSNDRRRA